jgi:prevent-host-death family protein
VEVRKVNVHEAKTQLSKLLEEVEKGERVVIARAGEPVAMLVPYEAPERVLGVGRGQVVIHDNFDEYDDEEQIAFGMKDDDK